MVIDKKRVKEGFKKIGNEAIDDLEPVVKKGIGNILDFVKEIIDECVTTVFESRKNSKGVKTNEKSKE